MADVTDNFEDNDLSAEELTFENSFLLNALVDILIEKDIISEDELYQRYEDLLSQAEEEAE